LVEPLAQPVVELAPDGRGFTQGQLQWDEDPPPSYNVSADDVEVESEGDLDVDDGTSPNERT
jgi:hypothetical protein